MKRTLLMVSMLTLIAMMAGQLQAETDIKTSGQIRMRCELDNDPENNFAEDAATVHTTFLRSRLNLDVSINKNASAYIQFQDSRRFGTMNSGGIGADEDDRIYLHQETWFIWEIVVLVL